jgi:hypothetical protein
MGLVPVSHPGTAASNAPSFPGIELAAAPPESLTVQPRHATMAVSLFFHLVWKTTLRLVPSQSGSILSPSR